MKKEDFSSKLKNNCPNDDEKERTKEMIKLFDINHGEELTKLYCKSVVILLSDAFEKFVKVSNKEYGINPLYCISLPGYTYQCALKSTDIKLQTPQDKDLNLLLENNIRGGISSVMGNRFVISDHNKKIYYMDATNLHGQSMSQSLPFDEIKKWHGHSDLCMKKLEKIFNTPDDNDIGYFIDVGLKYPDNIKEKTKNFPFAPEIKRKDKDKYND